MKYTIYYAIDSVMILTHYYHKDDSPFQSLLSLDEDKALKSNTGENLEPENAQQWQVNEITGDSRKFSEYVLVPNHKSGKDKIFLGLLCYRPNSLDDAQALLETYITQAQAKFAAQDYTVGERDRHGQRFTIVIEIRDKKLLTGWILDNQGTLKLATPFSGFANGGNRS